VQVQLFTPSDSMSVKVIVAEERHRRRNLTWKTVKFGGVGEFRVREFPLVRAMTVKMKNNFELSTFGRTNRSNLAVVIVLKQK
jgi:hypothetical protein